MVAWEERHRHPDCKNEMRRRNVEGKVLDLDARVTEDTRRRLHLRDMTLQNKVCETFERDDEGLGATQGAARDARREAGNGGEGDTTRTH